MKLRDANYKKYKVDQSPITWNEFKALKNKVNNIVNRQKFLYFRQKFNNYNDTNAIWKEVNNLSRKKPKQDIPADFQAT